MTDTTTSLSPRSSATSDLLAGMVAFLVALPLCLGIAQASGTPLFSGLISGIVGGLAVGMLSGSHTSISGPAVGLTAVVLAQIADIGSFEAFLPAVLVAGGIQIVMGLCRAGFLSAFFPSSVIKGLLAAIGLNIILKQVPHLLGHDKDPEGEMSFIQPDQETTFSELYATFGEWHVGAAAVGLVSLAFLFLKDHSRVLRKVPIPGALMVVAAGVLANVLFQRLGGVWPIDAKHLVQVPTAGSMREFFGFFTSPDWQGLLNPMVYMAGVTIALVASLETLLNVEAVDKLDPQKRSTPASRELVAQGLGNTLCGLFGGLPLTTVVPQGAVSIYAGARTKRAAIFHGALLLLCASLLPQMINLIPLAALAAILIVTGIRLASPKLFRTMWSEGPIQFAPFITTVAAIILTDLLIGILIGLGVATMFILHGNLQRPMRRIVEKHIGGDVLRIELANQVSFLNRAALSKTLHNIPPNSQVLLDARNTDYIDPDVLDLIHEFETEMAPARHLKVSLLGFRDRYRMEDRTEYVDLSSRDLLQNITPARVLQILKDGNERFRIGQPLTRDPGRQVTGTATGQFPLAVVLSCIDSRAPAEIIFDLGLGDIFSVRVAGNVINDEILGSMEYGCAVVGSKLVLVMGHTRCGAVSATVNAAVTGEPICDTTGCLHLKGIIAELEQSIDRDQCPRLKQATPEETEAFVDQVARDNVLRMIEQIRARSRTLARLEEAGQIAIMGGIYDVRTGLFSVLGEAVPNVRATA